MAEQKEKVDDCASAYENAQTETELTSITSELELQTKTMNDLLAKDKLTYTEQGQAQKDLAIGSAELINKQYGKTIFRQ